MRSAWISGLTFSEYVAEGPTGLVRCQEIPEVMDLTLWSGSTVLTAWRDCPGGSCMYFLADGHFFSPKPWTVQWLKAMFSEKWLSSSLVTSPGLVMWRSSMKIEGKTVSWVKLVGETAIVSFQKVKQIRLNSERHPGCTNYLESVGLFVSAFSKERDSSLDSSRTQQNKYPWSICYVNMCRCIRSVPVLYA